jgi:hypothetical protein
MTTVVNGVVGGAVVGLVAAVVVGLVRRDDGDGNNGPRGPGWLRPVAYILYGAAAGGVLVALELSVLGVLGVPPGRLETLVLTLVWSAVLFGAVTTADRAGADGSVLGDGLDRRLAFHVLYGIGLGFWIRLTWVT